MSPAWTRIVPALRGRAVEVAREVGDASQPRDAPAGGARRLVPMEVVHAQEAQLGDTDGGRRSPRSRARSPPAEDEQGGGGQEEPARGACAVMSATLGAAIGAAEGSQPQVKPWSRDLYGIVTSPRTPYTAARAGGAGASSSADRAPPHRSTPLRPPWRQAAPEPEARARGGRGVRPSRAALRCSRRRRRWPPPVTPTCRWSPVWWCSCSRSRRAARSRPRLVHVTTGPPGPNRARSRRSGSWRAQAWWRSSPPRSSPRPRSRAAGDRPVRGRRPLGAAARPAPRGSRGVDAPLGGRRRPHRGAPATATARRPGSPAGFPAPAAPAASVLGRHLAGRAPRSSLVRPGEYRGEPFWEVLGVQKRANRAGRRRPGRGGGGLRRAPVERRRRRRGGSAATARTSTGGPQTVTENAPATPATQRDAAERRAAGGRCRQGAVTGATRSADRELAGHLHARCTCTAMTSAATWHRGARRRWSSRAQNEEPTRSSSRTRTRRSRRSRCGRAS